MAAQFKTKPSWALPNSQMCAHLEKPLSCLAASEGVHEEAWISWKKYWFKSLFEAEKSFLEHLQKVFVEPLLEDLEWEGTYHFPR